LTLSSPIVTTFVFAGVLLQAVEEEVDTPFSFEELGYRLSGEGSAPGADAQAFE
jgi:hypothetical protein